MEEAEWAIEVIKEMGIPVALTMGLGPTGDIHNVTPGACAVRMAKAGELPCSINGIHSITTGRARLIRTRLIRSST